MTIAKITKNWDSIFEFNIMKNKSQYKRKW